MIGGRFRYSTQPRHRLLVARHPDIELDQAVRFGEPLLSGMAEFKDKAIGTAGYKHEIVRDLILVPNRIGHLTRIVRAVRKHGWQREI